MKNIPKCNEADISLKDVQQGEEIFERGVTRMSDSTVYAAVTAKRTDAESKRLRALATAWDLVERNMQQLEDDAVFTIAAHIDDLTACRVANAQLDRLEEIGTQRELSLEDIDMQDVECRSNKCLDSTASGVPED
ncbi:hypothetical protein EV702DRAFT_1194505 [Suillus placidus]|uniref:Uncharacterized protein n=1 Tax=Suillus placidus TaxID=48579 RepID=A0A9P7D6G9_9AGAM|nr:hypothetical protein EV702DRAFT_1194505 [Suillus placidus]